MRAREAKPRAAATACTIDTVPHTMIDVHRSYVPFWLHGVVGVDLRPDSLQLQDVKLCREYIIFQLIVEFVVLRSSCSVSPHREGRY
jgi:hypothetical protein